MFDFTDEEMIAVLRHRGYTITIGKLSYDMHSSVYYEGCKTMDIEAYLVTNPNGEDMTIKADIHTRKNTGLRKAFIPILKEALLKLMLPAYRGGDDIMVFQNKPQHAPTLKGEAGAQSTRELTTKY